MSSSVIDKDHTYYLHTAEGNRVQREGIYKEYADVFNALCAYSDFSNEVGIYLNSIIHSGEMPHLQFSILRLHEKALKLYEEAFILIEHGSASGAMARWRVLYEISVVSSILYKYPELAKKYIEYYHVNYYKYIKKMYSFRKRLNLTDEYFTEYKNSEKEYKRVCNENNWTNKDGFDWARCADIKKPNLFELAKNVELEHLYAHVDESNLYNHASTFYLVSERGSYSKVDNKRYLFTPYDLFLPIHLIFYSLNYVTETSIFAYESVEGASGEKLGKYLNLNADFNEKMTNMLAQEILKDN